MEATTVIAVFVALVGTAKFIVELAQLQDETWSVLRRWGRRAANVGRYAFALFALANGCLGVYLFANAAGSPTRKDVLYLLIFVANIAIGIWQLYEAGKAKRQLLSPE